MTNHGIIPGKLESDWLGGAIPWENRNPSGIWYSYLVVGENQKFGSFETFACVSFATNNTCEIQIKQQTGVEINRSDRHLAKVSGTTHQGNRVSTVLDAARKAGFVLQARWDTPPNPTWDTYYAPIPSLILAEGVHTLISYDLQYEYVTDFSSANIQKQLQHAPLLITIPGHEITAISFNHNTKTFTVLDDYVFNVDPDQPFIRTIKLSEVTDIYKAVLTIKDSMRLVNDNGTFFLEGEKGKIGIADYPFLAALRSATGIE